jgi:hypothetical protein
MLGEIEALTHEIAALTDNTAHDLRTPLTRCDYASSAVASALQRWRNLQAVADRSIAGFDQSLAMVAALLRIAEIEHSRRLDGSSRPARPAGARCRSSPRSDRWGCS